MNNQQEAIIAGGCFWGVEYLLRELPGVLSIEVGYIGGKTENPTYEEVCSHMTGHLEAVKVVFNLEVLTYESLLKYFFEIHDPTQKDGQGPDIGSQYLSAIFYFNDKQKEISEKVVALLKEGGFKVSTVLRPSTQFWRAEDYHQQYYEKHQKVPYCHFYTKRF